MTDLIAVLAGSATLVAVLLLGAAARRPPARRMPPADEPVAPTRPPRSAIRTVPILVAALAAGVGAAALGPLPVALAGGTGLAVRAGRRRAGATARARAVEAAMPDAVELLVLCIGAGCSPTQAVSAVAARAPPAVRPAFAEVERLLHRGRSLAHALDALSSTGAMGHEVALAITAATRDGLPLAPVLDRLATDARAGRRRLDEADARRLPVRLTFPLVLCTLPSFVLLAIAPAVLGALSTLRDTAP